MNYIKEYVVCPKCNQVLDKITLYSLDCICVECGHFIDMDEMELNNSMDYDDWLMERQNNYETARNFFAEDYYDDYDDYYFEQGKRNIKEGSEKMSRQLALPYEDEDELDCVGEFIIRFVTSANYENVKKGFEELDADVQYMELVNDGKIREFLKSKGGEKLAKGLNIDADDLEEYVLDASFFLPTIDDEEKKVLVSTLCQAFPLCLIKEEGSKYIMANNKGLAKGIIDICNEDAIEVLSLFLTGFEKYKILCNYLYWCEPYKNKQASEVMVMWDNDSLISLDVLRKKTEVPVIWQEYLSSINEIKVSASKDDTGTTHTFEQMLEDVVDNYIRVHSSFEIEDAVEVVSLRGLSEYSIVGNGEEEGDDDA